MLGRAEQFHSMYTQWYLRKAIINYNHRAIYKNWNNWCHRGTRYDFDKGYDEDYLLKKAMIAEGNDIEV